MSEIETSAAFDLIRYAQCWEDADILLSALQVQEGDVCLSIASAGDNSLALLACNPAKVIAIDLSAAQLCCLALRVAAYRHLEHVEMLALIGSTQCDDRRSLFDRCRPSLDDTVIRFWESRMADVEEFGIGGVGKFENYFRLFRTRVLPLVHSRGLVDELLRDKPLNERRDFYRARWNNWRWRLMMGIFFSRHVMGRLGRDPTFFKYAKGRVGDHLTQRIEHALQDLNPAKNPYLQWIVTGHHQTALPFALRPENYDAIRANLDRLEWRRQSVEEFINDGEKADAFNLSDIFEYMSESAYEALYTGLLDSANPGARFAYWNMMVPRFKPSALERRIEPREELAAKLFREDKALFYSRFVVEVAV